VSDPRAEKVPAAQLKQLDMPERFWYLPASQLAEAVALISAWNIPAVHFEQSRTSATAL